MSDKTPFAGLNKVGTYLDEDLPKFNENTDILDAQLKQAHLERREEEATRLAADDALGARLDAEIGARASEDGILATRLLTETRDREAANTGEAEAREAGDTAVASAAATALSNHDSSAVAHDALVRRITVGDISPIIGVCQIETGNCTGLWYNVDGEGQPITPNARYFDYHPVYSAMRRVLVDGQVMVKNAPFWFKHLTPSTGPFAGKLCRIISPGPAEGFRPYPAFLDTSGNVADALYVGAYQGTDEGSSKIGSRPGKEPIVSLDFPTMRTRCANRNTGGVTGFRMWDIYHYSALCNLFLIEFASTESQGIIGCGHVDSSSANYTDSNNQPLWRGYAGLWGNVWQMVDGLRLTAGRDIEIFKNDGSQSYVNTGKKSPSYDGTNAAYVITNHTGSGAGFNCEDCFLPATQSTGYTAGTFPDHFYGGSGSAGNVLYVGGSWSSSGGAGLFCWSLSRPASHSGAYIGCRLAKL